MTSDFRNALGEALTRLKRADVRGAAAAIQRSLGLLAPPGPPITPAPKSGAASSQTRASGAAPIVDPPSPTIAPPPEPLFRPPGDEQAKALKRAAGFTRRTYYSNAGSLAYKLYVPADCPTDHLALIVMLHGCTQDPDDFARGTDMNALADEFGFIVAYPHQPLTANPHGCWNWFDTRHQRKGSGEPVLIAGLAQELAREFMIGGNRIFVAGLSAGGAMADVLATAYPEVFSAVGIHSGLPSGAAKSALSAVAAMKGMRLPARRPDGARYPVVRKIIFHGDADRTVSAVNGRQIFNRCHSRQMNVADVTTDETMNGRKVTRTSIMRPDGSSLAEYWLIHGTGHAWSGGQTGGTFVEAAGPDASREMVRFFLQK
jgi:poly(hydroxyalkanoate) depolymerase family esterase